MVNVKYLAVYLMNERLEWQCIGRERSEAHLGFHKRLQLAHLLVELCPNKK